MEKKSFLVWVIFLLGVMIAAALIQYLKTPSEGGYPSIQIKPRVYDFGDIPRQIVKTTFIIENTGESDLEIVSVSTSCGCTIAEVSKGNIGPGDNAELYVKMDPNVMGNITGNVERTIYVQSNDPDKQEVEVKIKARIMG